MTHKTSTGEDCVFRDNHEGECYNSKELTKQFIFLFVSFAVVVIATRLMIEIIAVLLK